MTARTPLVAGLCLTAGLAVFAPTMAYAAPAAVCDAYSGTCTTPPPTSPPTSPPGDVDDNNEGGGGSGGGGGGDELPFTGGEAVLVGVLGLGALTGGAFLVIAGRRRATDLA